MYSTRQMNPWHEHIEIADDIIMAQNVRTVKDIKVANGHIASSAAVVLDDIALTYFECDRVKHLE